MNRHLAIATATFALIACNKETAPSESRDNVSALASSAPAPATVMHDMASQGIVQSTFAEKGAIGGSEGNQASDGKSETSASSAAAITAGTAEVSPSMIIRTGQASIEVSGLDPAMVKLRQLSAQVGGYIANSSFSGGRDQVRTATIELKIPAARYEQAVGGLNGIGKLESINTAAEDVGEEYVDVAARVANSRRLEERLVSLLATRTGKLEDVLAVERELARVREEIERYDGRMRFLKTRSAISTLSVALHEPYPILGRTPGQNPIAVAVRQAWRNFVGLIAAIIASMGVLIPVAVLAGFAWAVYRRAARRSEKRISTPQA
ncbi:MAG: DUF4349 domain-containing protein [Gemmatimonadaceae bacterium]